MTYELLNDAFSQKLWSYDASFFEMRPKIVALPTCLDDVLQLVEYARTNSFEITARGGGTGTTGGCLGKGLIIDLSKSMRSILSFNEQTLSVTVETGATLDDVNCFLRTKERMIGADLSTSDRATIGGMIASNAAGSHSRTWGSMREQIEAVEVVFSDGTSRWLDFSKESTDSALIQGLFSIRKQYKEIILRERPQIQRNAFHIPLDELLYPDGVHTARLFSGSQGTLGILTKARLKTVPLTEVRTSTLLAFRSIMEALNSTEELIRKNFYGIELIDTRIVKASQLQWLFSPDSAAYVLLESSTDDIPSINPQSLKGLQQVHSLSSEEYTFVLQVRKEGLSNLLSTNSEKTPSGFIEDLICPVSSISSFYGAVFEILDRYQCSYAVYGHMGSGCLHIRPFLYIRNKASDRPFIPKIMEEVGKLVTIYRGSMSSEHGSGLIRSWMTPLLFSSEYQKALEAIKNLFDPINIMNRGKLFPPYEEYATYFASSNKSTFSFHEENIFFRSHMNGGLETSLDSCTSNGRCRKGNGLMCPPFQITRDERDSTRGRVHALIERTETAHSSKEISSFNRILDLCIQCKGCIHDCPSHINLAKMKEEELWRQRKNGQIESWAIQLRSWMTGHLPTLLRRMPSLLLSFVRFISHSTIFQWMASKAFSLSSDALSSLQLRKKYVNDEANISASGTVILFVDSFSLFFNPNSVRAAQELLEAIGETVLLYEKGCCGRALLSKGYLESAQDEVHKTIGGISLFPETLPILFLEPSCWSSIHDEWLDLPHIDEKISKQIASRSYRIEDFLFSRLNQIQSLFQGISFPKKRLFFHEHCHVRGLHTPSTRESDLSSHHTRLLLESIPHVSLFFDPQTSCCGMAGSFGIEKEHENLSRDIGRHTFSRINPKSIDGVITSGISCRSQINRLFPNTPVFHPVEFLYTALISKR